MRVLSALVSLTGSKEFDTIQYDTINQSNVRLEADTVSLISHVTKN